jgi:hypothetical protein
LEDGAVVMACLSVGAATGRALCPNRHPKEHKSLGGHAALTHCGLVNRRRGA